IAGTYNNIGVINRDNKNYDEALLYFEKALSIYDKSEIQTNRANSLSNIAEIYNHKGEFQKALGYIATAHEIMEQYSLGFHLIRVLRIFRDSYKGAENWVKALEYSELHAQELDRQLTQTHKSTVSITEADYYRAKIEKQAQLYKEQNADLQKSTKVINEKKHQLTLANRELSRSNELLSRIVSIISHDVRTPLANIIQALELINDGLLSPELQEEIFHQLRLSSSDIFDMLDEILSWGKASRGANGEEHDKSSYDLLDLVRSSMEIYHSTARHKGVEIEISFPESSITTNADQVFLKITLRNLLSNALKFTPKGGKIKISLSHKPDGISIVIADTGVGMDKAQIRALMAGKGVTKPGTASEKGFGLGFSFCLDAIKRLGAKLKLDSDPGAGTVAEILLPEDKPQSS
ncbi:MAG: tetratricopeptide repeat-containing sensor histidine kinase, partial [Candidatus Cloacimonadaceae bacterium]|nr:tetratricopeptide repeat-containing sensor histidine kinase [Candidatus Cloacimonadaceae bacterium]